MTRWTTLSESELAGISARNRAARVHRGLRDDAGHDVQVAKPVQRVATAPPVQPSRAFKPSGKPIKRIQPKGYERILESQCRLAGLSQCSMEYRFHPVRKWRIDLAWPERMLAVEIDGAVHRIRNRFHADMEKHQALFFDGWRLLRVSTGQVRSGAAVSLIERALA